MLLGQIIQVYVHGRCVRILSVLCVFYNWKYIQLDTFDERVGDRNSNCETPGFNCQNY